MTRGAVEVVEASGTIIVGGGSAGCVLAGRPSEDPSRSVLLLEAGPAYAANAFPPDLTSPYAPALEPNRLWGLPERPGIRRHPISAFAAKVLGGGSAINAAISRRARGHEFANW